MSKVLFWIVVAPMAAAIIVFSVNNRTEVVLDLWPLDTVPVPVPVPVYALALAAVVVGFLAGGLVAWNSAGKSRRRARTESRRADQAERDLAAAQDRIERLQSEAARQEPREELAQLPPDSF